MSPPIPTTHPHNPSSPLVSQIFLSRKQIIKKSRALYKMSKIFVVLRREIKMNTRKFISQAYQNKQAYQNHQAQQQGFQSLYALRCPNRSGRRES